MSNCCLSSPRPCCRFLPSWFVLVFGAVPSVTREPALVVNCPAFPPANPCPRLPGRLDPQVDTSGTAPLHSFRGRRWWLLALGTGCRIPAWGSSAVALAAALILIAPIARRIAEGEVDPALGRLQS